MYFNILLWGAQTAPPLKEDEIENIFRFQLNESEFPVQKQPKLFLMSARDASGFIWSSDG